MLFGICPPTVSVLVLVVLLLRSTCIAIDTGRNVSATLADVFTELHDLIEAPHNYEQNAT